MRKLLSLSICTALIISSLAACSQPEADNSSVSSTQPDASHVIETDGTQVVVDTPDGTNAIGLVDQQQPEVKEPLSGDELIEYFQKVYDIVGEFNSVTTEEELIQEELEFLVDLVDSDGEKLPADYEAQYMAWRPKSLQADNQDQQQPSNQQTQGQQSGSQQTQQGQTNQSKPGDQQQSQGQHQQPSGQQQQGQTQQPSITADLYDGYGSYDAMIDAACKKYPELSREEIMQRIPDPAGIHVDEEQAAKEAQEGLLNNGG